MRIDGLSSDFAYSQLYAAHHVTTALPVPRNLALVRLDRMGF